MARATRAASGASAPRATRPTLRGLAIALALAPLVGGALLGAGDGQAEPPRGDGAQEFPWIDQPMFRADAARTGNVPGARIPDAVTEAWRIQGFNPGAHTAAKGSAAAVGGVVYIGSDDGTLHALDARDGRTLWTAETFPSTNGIHGTPAVHAGLVIVGGYDGYLHAFDQATGERRWATRVGDYVGASPVVWRDLVFIAAETDRPSGILVVLDLEGRIVAQDGRLQSHPHSSPAIDDATGTVVVGDNTGNLTAWDASDVAGAGLRFLWVFSTRPDSEGANDIKGPIAVADGAAFFGSWDDRIYRVDLATGEKVWSYRAAGSVMSGAAIADGTLYIGSHADWLYALDVETGRLRWKFQAGDRMYGSPTVADGKVLIGSHDGFLYCLDAGTGRRLWYHYVGGYVTGTPVIAGDGILVAARQSPTWSGDLVMVRAA